LETIYADIVVGGKRHFPGWPVGSEARGSGWDPWFVRADGQPSTRQLFGETFYRYFVGPRPDPKFEATQFVAERDIPKLENIRQILDATDADLTGFQKRGGKLLMWFGWADPVLNPLTGVEYYERARERTGPRTTEFFRLFMAPGVFHCSGGVGPGSVNWLEPLMAWVEKGVAPDSVIATKAVQGKVEMARPLCKYPEVAKYKGSGDSNEAASFACVKP
jgi:feruloyl esterase